MKRTVALSLILALLSLSFFGCVHYVPREERPPETTSQTIETAASTTATSVVTTIPTTAETTAGASSETSEFPNETEDGHTKRY